MRIYLILILTSLFFISCLDGFEDIEKDNVSPFIESISWDSNNDFDISRDANQSFDKVYELGKNIGVKPGSKIEIKFSEEMYPQSLAEYGVSESVVILENEPSNTFLSDIKTPPLSDYNIRKIIKAKTYMLSDGKNKSLFIDFSEANDCVEENANENFCKLKVDTGYTLIVGASASDKNGRTLVVDSAGGGKVKGNFVLLFKTLGRAPKVIASSPASGEEDVCPGLKEITIDFDQNMDLASIDENSLYLSKNNNKLSTEMLKEAKKATLKLKNSLDANSFYSINVNDTIKSKSRMKLEKNYKIDFGTGSAGTGDVTSDFSAKISGRNMNITWTSARNTKAEFSITGSDTITQEEGYSKSHNVTINLTKVGTYNLSAKIMDQCGNEKTETASDLKVENHPIISEVSPNASGDDFVEVHNSGSSDIDLSKYKINDISFPATTTLSPGAYYAQNISLSKNQDIYLTIDGTSVDEHTKDFVPTSSVNKSFQKVNIIPFSQDYCYGTPTPNKANACD